MIGVDTNVLVRYLTKDDPSQYRIAAAFLESECSPTTPGFVNDIVLCELVWVLEGAYRYSREQIAPVLDLLLRVAQLRVESPTAVWESIKAYRDGHDFSDALIGQRNRNHGCFETTTLDRKASRLEGFRLLS